MKTNTLDEIDDLLHKPFHLHLEYFFRSQYVLLFVSFLFLVAVLKADAKTLSLMREAYVHGYGVVGEHMREETTRVPVTFEIAARVPTHSGK